MTSRRAELAHAAEASAQRVAEQAAAAAAAAARAVHQSKLSAAAAAEAGRAGHEGLIGCRWTPPLSGANQHPGQQFERLNGIGAGE